MIKPYTVLQILVCWMAVLPLQHTACYIDTDEGIQHSGFAKYNVHRPCRVASNVLVFSISCQVRQRLAWEVWERSWIILSAFPNLLS